MRRLARTTPSRRNEDTAYTFAAADFGFSDPERQPGEQLWRR